jgi:SAM-dependent methyltransferase
MISTEAAFHFDAREDFFGEAFRTLKTGGLLSLADIVFPEPRNGWQRMLLARMKNGLYIPAANIYGYESYLAKVKAAGFELVAAENITAKVRAPFRKWFGTHPLRTFFNHRLGWAIPNFGFLVYPWEYLTLVARKGNPR